MQLKKIIIGCRRFEPKAQKELYDLYRQKLWAVCLRYCNGTFDADDIFQESFLRIFRQIHTLKNESALDAWIKKIVVRTAINFCQSQQKHIHQESTNLLDQLTYDDEEEIIDRLSNDQLLELIQLMPEAYRMVFNLNVIDGFNHSEIGELLGISAHTSRSNLSRGKAWLRNKLIERKIFFE